MKTYSRRIRALVIALAAVASMLGGDPAHAQLAQVTGTASIEVKGGVFSSEPSKEDLRRARDAARLSVWKNYSSRFTPARLAQMDGRQQEITARLDEFMSDLVITDHELDKGTNTLRVAVRANINTAAVDRYFAGLKHASVPGSKSSGSTGAAGMLAFVFMARQVESIREFDARRVTVAESSSGDRRTRTDSDTDDSSGRSNSESAVSDRSRTLTTKSETGGSTTRKSAQVKYRVQSSQNVDTAVTDVLNSAGFELATYEDIVGSCGGPELPAIRDEFAESDEMGASLRNKVFDGAFECGIRFMSIGTLDVGAPDTDAVTGQKRVFVTVRAQVLDLGMKRESAERQKRPLARRVSSVGPVQMSGLGPDEQVATTNALKRAAADVAKTIVDQLNAKGVN